MIDKSKKISLLISRMLPSFVLEEYPQFNNFLRLLLEYIEREKGEYDLIANLLNYNDIDNTLSDFEYLFRDEFAKSFPVVITEDIDLLVKNIRDFYKKKGTEDSYKFLFRTIFNKNVEFFYPKFNILKASDGVWQGREYMTLMDVNGDIPLQHNGEDFDFLTLIGKYIIGVKTGAESYIDNVEIKPYNIPPDTDIPHIRIVEREVNYEDNEMAIIGTNFIYNGDFSALDSGWAFSISDDSFYADSGKFIIKQPPNNNLERYISQEVNVNESGNYYLRYTIEESDDIYCYIRVGYSPGSGEILNKRIPNGTTFPYVDFIELQGFNHNVPIYVSIVNDLYKDQKLVVDGISLVRKDEDYPFLFIAPNSFFTTDPDWIDTRGFISQKEIRLADNFYYQEYSYVLKSDLSISDYKSIVKDNVHPAGYLMFGDINHSEASMIGSSLGSSFNLVDFYIHTDLDKIIYLDNSMNLDHTLEIKYDIPLHTFKKTYEYVENNRENVLTNYTFSYVGTFDKVIIGDFESTPNKLFIYSDSFDIIIQNI